MTAQHRIAASILAANFARLGEEVERVVEAGADLIRFGVMDNHNLPNLTFGPMLCKAIRPLTKALDNGPLDRFRAGLGRAPGTRREAA